MNTKGTKHHVYTAAEFKQIARGEYLPDIDKRSQRYALERHLARTALNIEKGKRRKEPEMPEYKDYVYSKGEWV